MARSVLALILLLASVRPALGNNVVAGGIRLPAHFAPRQAFHRPGHWKLPNRVLPPLPPALDPREEMLVVLEGPITGAPPSATELVIEDGRFVPSVLAVRPGMQVAVANRDPMMHLLEAPGIFSGRRVSPGDAIKVPFPRPGTFELRCSELPHLVATVVVADKAAFAAPNAKGAFRFPPVPTGAYTLRVWYAGAWIHTQPVSVRAKRVTVDIQLMPLAAKE